MMDGLIIVLTFLLAGTVKGVIGMGLPTVSLSILTIAFDLPTAMALLIVPSVLTNVWQAMDGKQTLALIKQLWPFLLSATLFVALGTMAFKVLPLSGLSALLGVLLLFYAVINLAGFSMTIAPARQTGVGGALGCINGILTGMTGSCVVPGVMYLQALNLPRDSFIQAMGLLFTFSTLALGIALYANHLMTASLAAQSALGLLPAVIGMIAGKRLRKRLDDKTFRKVFFLSVLFIAIFIIWRGLVG